MFNTDKKEAFFAYCLNDEHLSRETVKKYRANFNSIGRYEKTAGRDVADMYWDDIVNMFTSCDIYKISYIRQIHSMLKKYVDWDNGINRYKMNHFKVYNPRDIAVLLRKSVEFSDCYFTPEEWEEYMGAVKHQYEESNAMYFQGLLTVLYYNICDSVKDIIYLDIRDVNWEAVTVKDRPVPPFALEILEKVYKLDFLNRRSRKDLGELNCSFEKTSIFKWNSSGEPGENIYESFKPITRHFLRDELKKVSGKKISSKSVYDCGLIHFLLLKYMEEGRKKEDFIEDLFSQKMDYKFNLWLSQRSAIGLSNFKYKYSDVIEYCMD